MFSAIEVNSLKPNNNRKKLKKTFDTKIVFIKLTPSDFFSPYGAFVLKLVAIVAHRRPHQEVHVMIAKNSSLRALLLSGLLAVSGPNIASASSMQVEIDKSAPVHLTKDASSIVLGNPAIADIHIQNSKLIFLQGRSFGTTNLIALDANGAEILNILVTVTSSTHQSVTLQRGITGRISYACANRCEQTLMPGDSPEHVKMLLETTTSITAVADQVATSQSEH